jgi:hypothetical protein
MEQSIVSSRPIGAYADVKAFLGVFPAIATEESFEISEIFETFMAESVGKTNEKALLATEESFEMSWEESVSKMNVENAGEAGEEGAGKMNDEFAGCSNGENNEETANEMNNESAVIRNEVSTEDKSPDHTSEPENPPDEPVRTGSSPNPAEDKRHDLERSSLEKDPVKGVDTLEKPSSVAKVALPCPLPL